MSSDTYWIFCSVPKDAVYTGQAAAESSSPPPPQQQQQQEEEKAHVYNLQRLYEKLGTVPAHPSPAQKRAQQQQQQHQVPQKLEVKFLEQETWEQVLDKCLAELEIKDVVSMVSKDGSRVQIYFPLSQEDNEGVMHLLHSRGFGTTAGTSIGFMPFTMFFTEEEEQEADEYDGYDDDSVFEGQELKKINSMSNKILSKLSSKLTGFKKKQEDFLKSVTSRLTVAQVVSGVKNSSKVTFDFVMYTFLAGCIASCGILNNAVTDIAAAMCIEPVMGTVLVGAFGTVIHDWSLIRMGIRNNCIVITECILTGFVYGVIAMSDSLSWHPPDGHWPTSEMVSRATYRSLVMGALQASAAGGAVALGLLTNNYTALVGVAIASTFLPHATNCGLLWAWTCHLSWRGMAQQEVTVSVINPLDNESMVVSTKAAFLPQPGYQPIFSYDMRWECMHLSYVSLLNTYVNVLCLYIGCALILKLKEVAPLGSFEPHRKFFQEDMRIYRDYHYNKRIAAQRRSAISVPVTQDRCDRDDEADDGLGEDILREWADIAGLDPKRLLSKGDPKAKVTQIQTLKDLAKEVENDKDYRAVTSRTTGIPEPDLVRRLTHGQLQVPQEFLDRHNNSHTISDLRGVDNQSFLADDSEMSGVHTVTQNRRRRGSRGVRIRMPSEYSCPSTPPIIEEYGLRPDDLEAGTYSTMPLRFNLRDRGNQAQPFSLWPRVSTTDGTPSPRPTSPRVSRASCASISSRINTRM